MMNIHFQLERLPGYKFMLYAIYRNIVFKKEWICPPSDFSSLTIKKPPQWWIEKTKEQARREIEMKVSANE